MNFLNKLSKYNRKISFNIFALNGYFIFLIFIYWNFLIEPDYSYVALIFIFNALIISIFLIAFIVNSVDWILWFCIYAIITAIYLVAFIVCCVEVVTQYKLPFAFLQKKQYTLILLFGAFISMIYLLLLIIFFALPLFM